MDRVVLPSNVVPLHYQMLIRPNPNNLDLSGFVRITVEVRDPTAEITLNAADLQFDHAVLCQSGNKTATVSFDTETQTATLHFDEVIQAGEYDIEIRYKGKIYESAQGLFISPYGTPEGRKHMLITQFEAVAARRFVPCWDEPAQKATFSISVDAPVGLTVVSNMPIDSVSELGDGFQHVQFQKTPKMSSYLLFVGIG